MKKKHAGRVWYKYLTKKLINEMGFTRSKIDDCIFYRGKTVYLFYKDDSILAGPDKEEIAQVIRDLKGSNLDVTDLGNMEEFLGINIQRKDE